MVRVYYTYRGTCIHTRVDARTIPALLANIASLAAHLAASAARPPAMDCASSYYLLQQRAFVLDLPKVGLIRTHHETRLIAIRYYG